jgi:two-component system chemotaxis sensor kinase CheA
VDDALYTAFVEETAPLAAEVESRLLGLERAAAALSADWRALLGVLHSIKGNCGMVELDDAQALAHAMEQQVRELRASPLDAQMAAVAELLATADTLRTAMTLRSPSSSPSPSPQPIPSATLSPPPTPSPGRDLIRLPAERIDRLLESTEELAAVHERTGAAVRALGRRRGVADPEVSPLLELVDQSRRRLRAVRTAVTDLRLLPLSTALARFDRVVRDLCVTTGKRATLAIRGGDVAVDKSVVDRIGEPLLHMVRNAIDHGIESPRERVRAGKPDSGRLTIEAETQGGVLTVIVRDDGRGVDRGKLAAAAARRGLDVAAMGDDQLLALVFEPELSTAERVTELSGRGIGLDQARRTLEHIGGSLHVESTRGQGTALRLRVPAVIAVQRALLLACAGEVYALPFTAVIEAFRLGGPRGATAAAVPWRDSELALCDLADELEVPVPGTGDGRPATCVIVDRGDQPLALAVDGLAGQQDVVIKPLDAVFGRPRGVSGAAVLPEGRVVLVVDPHGLGRGQRPARAS